MLPKSLVKAQEACTRVINYEQNEAYEGLSFQENPHTQPL